MTTCIAIDDDPIFLKLLQSYFDEINSCVLIGSYKNPVDGVMAITKEKPTVVLVDYEMPYLDGFEAIQMLEKPPKIIVISAHLQQPEAMLIPADRYIPKAALRSPYQLEKIIQDVTGSE